MNSLRHFLLAAVLVLAQFVAGAHAIEHAVDKDGGLPAHTCELCLAAHNLGAALPGVPTLPPVVEVVLEPEAVAFVARSHLPPPSARQGAPPAA